jgi:hypothetical protein
MSTNRVFQGISVTSQTNPESLMTLIEQPKRGLRVEAAMDEKWRTHPTAHSKSSVDFKGLPTPGTGTSSQYSRQYQSEKLGKEKEKKEQMLPEIAPSSCLDQCPSGSALSASASDPLRVGELFPQSIVQSIGRRSSTMARILPTSAPTLCDSPMKLRIL